MNKPTGSESKEEILSGIKQAFETTVFMGFLCGREPDRNFKKWFEDNNILDSLLRLSQEYSDLQNKELQGALAEEKAAHIEWVNNWTETQDKLVSDLSARLKTTEEQLHDARTKCSEMGDSWLLTKDSLKHAEKERDEYREQLNNYHNQHKNAAAAHAVSWTDGYKQALRDMQSKGLHDHSHAAGKQTGEEAMEFAEWLDESNYFYDSTDKKWMKVIGVGEHIEVERNEAISQFKKEKGDNNNG